MKNEKQHSILFVTSNGEIKTETSENFSHPLKVKATTNPTDKAINRVDLVSKKNNQTFNLVKKSDPQNVVSWDGNKFEELQSKIKNVDPPTSPPVPLPVKLNPTHIFVLIMAYFILISGFILAIVAKVFNFFK